MLHSSWKQSLSYAIAFTALMLLAIGGVGAEDSFDQAMKQMMADLNIRGASVAVMAPGLDEPIARGYGKVASSDDSASVTEETAFMFASVSKVFAGAAVAVLIDQGIIESLDDDICDVVPVEYNRSACRNPWFPNDPVTWRMIVTHRSSMAPSIPSVRVGGNRYVAASYGPTGGYDGEEPAAGNPTCPLKDVTGFYRDIMVDKESETMVGRDGLTLRNGEPVNWYDYANDMDFGGMWIPDDQPGEYFDYSNFAVGYLAALVEYATDQSFDQFSKEHIFSKLGMDQTSWFREDLPAGTDVAVPVRRRNGSFRDVGHYCYIDYASGQLYSTAKDMVLWGNAILERGVDKLWSEDTTNHVFGCQEQDENGSPEDETVCEFGLSWAYLDNAKKQRLRSSILNSNNPDVNWMRPFLNFDWDDAVEHSGGEEGVQSELIVFPHAGAYVMVVMNTSDNNESAAQILAKVAMGTDRKSVV